MQNYSFLLLASFSLILSACGTNKAYHITSDPSGAVVTSGDVVYGTTPFETDLNTILPNRQWDMKPSSSRKLIFTKAGFLPGAAVITEFGSAGSVHVKLERSAVVGTAEERLRDLKSLFDKGLISTDDYDRKRIQILDSQ